MAAAIASACAPSGALSLDLPPDVAYVAVLVGDTDAAEGRVTRAPPLEIRYARKAGEGLRLFGYRQATFEPVARRATSGIEGLELSVASCGARLPAPDYQWRLSGEVFEASSEEVGIVARGVTCDGTGYWAASRDGNDDPVSLEGNGSCGLSLSQRTGPLAFPLTLEGAICVEPPPPGCGPATPPIGGVSSVTCDRTRIDFYPKNAPQLLSITATATIAGGMRFDPPAAESLDYRWLHAGPVADLVVSGDRVIVAARAPGDFGTSCDSPALTSLHILRLDDLAEIGTATAPPCLRVLATSGDQIFALHGVSDVDISGLDRDGKIHWTLSSRLSRRLQEEMIPIEVLPIRDGAVLMTVVEVPPPNPFARAEFTSITRADGSELLNFDLSNREVYFATFRDRRVFISDVHKNSLLMLDPENDETAVLASPPFNDRVAVRGPMALDRRTTDAVLVSWISDGDPPVGAAAAPAADLVFFDFSGGIPVQPSYPRRFPYYARLDSRFTAAAASLDRPSTVLVSSAFRDALLVKSEVAQLDLGSSRDASDGAFLPPPLSAGLGAVSRIRAAPGGVFVLLYPWSGRVVRVLSRRP